jgi:hypothetical protein
MLLRLLELELELVSSARMRTERTHLGIRDGESRLRSSRSNEYEEGQNYQWRANDNIMEMEGWRFTIMKKDGIGVIAFRGFGHGISKSSFSIAFREGWKITAFLSVVSAVCSFMACFCC